MWIAQQTICTDGKMKLSRNLTAAAIVAATVSLAAGRLPALAANADGGDTEHPKPFVPDNFHGEFTGECHGGVTYHSWFCSPRKPPNCVLRA